MSSPDLAARLLAFTRVVIEEGIELSAEELLCFLAVAVRPGLSVGELVEETGLPQSTVSRHIKRMSMEAHRSAGEFGPLSWKLLVGFDPLLCQEVHPSNGKQKALRLSPRGEALLDRFETVMNGAA